MGASGWAYFVPYKSSVKDAFQELKKSTFRSKDYYDPYARYSDDLSFEEFLPTGIELTEDLKRIFRLEYESVLKAQKVVPTTIDELLRKNGESGTHSILDIREISDTDDRNHSGRMSDTDLQSMFSTLTPSREQVEEKQMDIQTYRGRWMCTYVIIFKDAEPSELFFTGYSGD